MIQNCSMFDESEKARFYYFSLTCYLPLKKTIPIWCRFNSTITSDPIFEFSLLEKHLNPCKRFHLVFEFAFEFFIHIFKLFLLLFTTP
jgi:hypothetical protein